MPANSERLQTVDILRGMAVLLMLVSNLQFDLSFFIANQSFPSGLWTSLAKVAAGLFILVAGISLTLSQARARISGRAGFGRSFKRGLFLLGLGGVISLVTWFALGADYIRFGALHLIGSSIILAYPFLRCTFLNPVLGTMVIGAGIYLDRVQVDFPWLLWAGLKYPEFSSVDYIPIFPWFGLFLWGIFLGNFFFPNAASRFHLRAGHKWSPASAIACLGRHSLAIYLIHQPLFIGLIILACRF